MLRDQWTEINQHALCHTTQHPQTSFRELCVCDEYVYLGTTFNSNNTFKKAINKQVCQAKRALFSMKNKIFLLQLPIDIQLELFDHLILPIW